MRRLAVAAAAALVAAGCGSSSSSSSTPPAVVAGTIMNQPFTAVDGSALQLSQGSCNLEGVDVHATGLLLGFGSFSGLCSFVSEHHACGTKANATIVNVLLVRVNLSGGTASPVQPGTYAISAATPMPDATGTIAVAFVSKTDASCAEPQNLPHVTGGTVTITAVGTRTTGSVSLTLSDGGSVAGSFDVATCTGFQTDVCTILEGGSCPSVSCVP